MKAELRHPSLLQLFQKLARSELFTVLLRSKIFSPALNDDLCGGISLCELCVSVTSVFTGYATKAQKGKLEVR